MRDQKTDTDQSLFFERLKTWENTPRAIEAFDSILFPAIAETEVVFHKRLYGTLIDHLLDWLDLPRSGGARMWEWKPLYQFGEETDPFYYTERSIHGLLARWPIIGEKGTRVIASVLDGYFQLRRAGFPAKFPSPRLPNQEVARWTRIFPPEWAWESMDILRKNGLLPMASRRAYRVFARYSDGTFQPEPTSNSIRRWQAECWLGSLKNRRGEEDDFGPYRANFLAAVFAGRFGALGIEGVCSYVPDCERCALSGECRWYNASPSDQPGPSEILTLARRGEVGNLRTDQLLQGLFHLKEPDMETLRGKIAGTSLRALATRNFQELKDWFGFQWLMPERLRVTFELSRRFNEERMSVGEPFRTSWDIFKHFRIRLRDLRQEQFIVVLLDNKKRYLSDLVVTQGTLNSSPVHPREVFNAAIRERAASVVVVHNHPSGDPNPSKEDIEVTRLLMEAGELIGIPVLDHVIIADEKFTSLMEQGLLNV